MCALFHGLALPLFKDRVRQNSYCHQSFTSIHPLIIRFQKIMIQSNKLCSFAASAANYMLEFELSCSSVFRSTSFKSNRVSCIASWIFPDKFPSTSSHAMIASTCLHRIISVDVLSGNKLIFKLCREFSLYDSSSSFCFKQTNSMIKCRCGFMCLHYSALATLLFSALMGSALVL